MLAATVGYGQRAQVFGVSCTARVALSRMVAVEVCVFGGGVKGRREDIGAASAQSWGRFYVAEGAIDGLELLFANL
jgi:hypothetical protein